MGELHTARGLFASGSAVGDRLCIYCLVAGEVRAYFNLPRHVVPVLEESIEGGHLLQRLFHQAFEDFFRSYGCLVEPFSLTFEKTGIEVFM